MNSFQVAGGSPGLRVAGGAKSIQPSIQPSIQSSVICHLPSAIDSAIHPYPYPYPYPINFNTCSASNAMPRPEKPMRVSVIVHVRKVWPTVSPRHSLTIQKPLSLR